MKSMKKAFNANKVVSSLKKRSSVAPDSQQPAGGSSAGPSPAAVVAEANGQSPEAAAHNSVKAFCESGGNVQGDEILFLPPIVDAAESSPAAAAECARLIAKFLSKEYNSRPSWQYNALMLIRILVDNPGETFTRNLAEREFVETTRKLLKHGRDSRVRQMLMETLDDFEHTKQYDPNLTPLVEMWKAQKEDAIKKNGGVPPNAHRQRQAPRFNPYSSQQQQQNYFARNHANKRLPDAVELASRLEEARTSAKLLEQVVMNTPPGEMLKSDLIKEFADRCQSASRSIQTYMVADNPSPDNETMESLIDTNEQLQTALNQHQRAVLNARKQLGLNERGADANGQEVSPLSPSSNGRDRVLEWQQTQAQLYASGEQPESPDIPAHGNGKGKETSPYEHNQAGGSGAVAGASGSGTRRHADEDDAPGEDPFRDPQPEETGAEQRHHFEPFNPGFTGADDSAPALASSGAAGAAVPRKAVGSGDAAATAHPKDNVSEEDIYDAQDKTKDPVYRY